MAEQASSAQINPTGLLDTSAFNAATLARLFGFVEQTMKDVNSLKAAQAKRKNRGTHGDESGDDDNSDDEEGETVLERRQHDYEWLYKTQEGAIKAESTEVRIC